MFLCLALTVVFASCEGPIENPAGYVTELVGMIDNMAEAVPPEAGPCTLKLQVYDTGGEMFVPIASGSVSDDGTFSIELPATLDPTMLAPMFYDGYEGVTISAPETQMAAASFHLYDRDGQRIGNVIYRSNAQRGGGSLQFYDRDCTVTGSLTVFGGIFEPRADSYELNLKKGWNWVFSYPNENDNNYALITKIPADAGFSAVTFYSRYWQ